MPVANLVRPYGNVFRVIGQKEIYLPPIQNVITLLRTKHLPPSFARFRVPLNWNKLDLKDYLYHAYGVESLHVRSVVRLSPIEENKPSELRVRGRRWHRPASKKYMTIRMEKPFVWPEEPLDYKPWDRESYEAANDQRREEEEAMTPKGNSMEPSDAKWLKEKAAKLRNERKEKAARQLAELQQRQRQEAERRVQRQAAEKMERQAAREAARLERSEAKRQSSE